MAGVMVVSASDGELLDNPEPDPLPLTNRFSRSSRLCPPAAGASP
jgi:hypothetical protein